MDAVAVREVRSLLEEWEQLLWTGSERARANIIRIRGDLGARIRVPSPRPVITDEEWHRQQQGIQTSISSHLPQLKPLIWSEPDLRGDWPARDYLDLYSNHYANVIKRLREVVPSGCSDCSDRVDRS